MVLASRPSVCMKRSLRYGVVYIYIYICHPGLHRPSFKQIRTSVAGRGGEGCAVQIASFYSDCRNQVRCGYCLCGITKHVLCNVAHTKSVSARIYTLCPKPASRFLRVYRTPILRAGRLIAYSARNSLQCYKFIVVHQFHVPWIEWHIHNLATLACDS